MHRPIFGLVESLSEGRFVEKSTFPRPCPEPQLSVLIKRKKGIEMVKASPSAGKVSHSVYLNITEIAAVLFAGEI